MKWKTIPGYEGLYEVSDDGQVRSLDHVVTYSDGRQAMFKGKELSIFIVKGYCAVRLSKQGQTKQQRVHRLMASAFYGPSDLIVRHLDDVKMNNVLSNLAYGTNSENQLDAVNNGKQVGRTELKLIPADVKLIRLMSSFGFTQTQIAELIGIGRSHVSSILSGRYWGSVPA